MNYFEWSNPSDKFKADYMDANGLNLSKLKMNMNDYQNDDMLRVVVLSHRNCLIHKLFGKPL